VIFINVDKFQIENEKEGLRLLVKQFLLLAQQPEYEAHHALVKSKLIACSTMYMETSNSNYFYFIYLFRNNTMILLDAWQLFLLFASCVLQLANHAVSFSLIPHDQLAVPSRLHQEAMQHGLH